MLTAFMLTSVLSIGLSFYESMRMSNFRFEGIYSHAALGGLSYGQLNTLNGLGYVRHVSQAGMVGMAELPHGEIPIFYADADTWRYFQTPVFTNIQGRAAVEENEIMLSRSKLAHMGINEPYVGMEIPLTFTLYRHHGDSHNKTFILSGFYTEFVSIMGSAGTPIFVSEAFAYTHALILPEATQINIIFTNHLRINTFTQRLAQDLNLQESPVTHPALERDVVNIGVMYTAMGIFITFFMFTGFLLVYNVMYVSVSKDVRFYGLLKTLGTTPRQLNRIVNGQVIRLYAIGMPIGLLIAAAVSLVLIPVFVGDISTGTVVSFSPIIYVGGALFTLFTTRIGAFTSARKAARVSPIESTKYAGDISHANDPLPKACHASSCRPHRMAWRNAFRERKRAIIVLISLFMSVTVFTTTITITNIADVDSEVAYFYDFDFILSRIQPLDEDFIQQVAAIEGVASIHPMVTASGMIEELGTGGTIIGVDAAWLEEVDPDIGKRIDLDAFTRGELALRDDWWILFHERNNNAAMHFSRAGRDDLPIGTKAELVLGTTPSCPATTIIIADSLRRIRPIGSIFTSFHVSSGAVSMDMTLIMSVDYLRQRVDDLNVQNLGVSVYPGADLHVRAALDAIMPWGVELTSTYEARQEMQAGMATLLVLGTGLALILGLIGVFNFINVIAVSLIVRKRELATLESIGMSKRQMRAMLRWEGAVYWIIVLVMSMLAGPPIAFGLFNALANSPMFANFAYPILPIAVSYVIIVIICSITPELAYRSISKRSLIERLRDV